MIKDTLRLRGDVAIVLKDKNGAVKDSRQITNLLVDEGLEYVCASMAGTEAGQMTHMAVGSDATAPVGSNTGLGAILGVREALDSTTALNNTITYVSSFEPGEGTGAIVEAGIFDAVTDGIMLCRTTFAVINKGADDTMAITWTITLTAS